MTALNVSRKVKPFYENGDHCLWSDIVADLTPFQALRPIDRYDNISFGLAAVRIGVDIAHNTINVGRITAFADKYMTRWEEKLEFAERFMTASQKRGLIH